MRRASLLSLCLLAPLACGEVVAEDADGSPGGGDSGALDGSAGADGGLDAAPMFNHALAFDGADDVVTIPTDPLFNITDQLTLEAWIFPTETNFGGIAGRWGEVGTFHFVVSDGGVLPRIQDATGQTHSNYEQITAETWTHVAMVFDGNQLQIVKNGVASGANDAAAQINTNDSLPFEVGVNRISPSPSFLAGRIDEVRLWSVARSPEEIAADRNQKIDPTAAGLVGYWQFDEAMGEQQILDSTPNGLDGTLGASDAEENDDPSRVTSDAPLTN